MSGWFPTGIYQSVPTGSADAIYKHKLGDMLKILPYPLDPFPYQNMQDLEILKAAFDFPGTEAIAEVYLDLIAHFPGLWLKLANLE